MMINRTFKELIVKETVPIGGVLLEARGLTYPGQYYDINLKVRRGEIVGMAGLVGAGRSEAASAIFGTSPALSGEIYIKGEKAVIRNPLQAMRKGISMVSEDRAHTGLITPFSIKYNMTFAILYKIAAMFGFIRNKKENELGLVQKTQPNKRYIVFCRNVRHTNSLSISRMAGIHALHKHTVGQF